LQANKRNEKVRVSAAREKKGQDERRERGKEIDHAM
jgi:hypothetical protein